MEVRLMSSGILVNLGVPLHFYRATKYIVLLFKIIPIKDYKRVCGLAFVIRHAERIFFRAVLYSIAICGLSGCTYFSTLSHKRQDFIICVTEDKRCVLISLHFCTKHFSL